MSIRRWLEFFVRTIMVMSFILLFSACAKPAAKTAVVEQTQPVTEAKPSADKQIAESQPVVEKQAVLEKMEESSASLKKKVELRKQHIVRRGDSLWWIAKYKDHYNDPYLWPLIYEANKKIIKNPDLIYPGQKFMIPRTGFSMDDVKRARKKAGATKPYMPPQNSNPPVN